MVERLDIGLINALTPQAKGRVERANHTLQDRLVKEMRLRGIGSMAEGQAFLAEFMCLWNAKFVVPPRDPASAHRPWAQSEDALALALASREERTRSKALTFSYGGTKYCANTSGPGTAMRGGKILVHRLIDGRLHVTYKERVLRLTAYGTYPVPDPAADEKTLDVRVEAIAAARQTATARVCGATDGLKPGGFAAPLRGYGVLYDGNALNPVPEPNGGRRTAPGGMRPIGLWSSDRGSAGAMPSIFIDPNRCSVTQIRSQGWETKAITQIWPAAIDVSKDKLDIAIAGKPKCRLRGSPTPRWRAWTSPGDEFYPRLKLHHQATAARENVAVIVRDVLKLQQEGI